LLGGCESYALQYDVPQTCERENIKAQ